MLIRQKTKDDTQVLQKKKALLKKIKKTCQKNQQIATFGSFGLGQGRPVAWKSNSKASGRAYGRAIYALDKKMKYVPKSNFTVSPLFVLLIKKNFQM